MARLGLSPPPRVRRARALSAALLLCSGCGGDYVRLGSSEPLLVGGDAGSGATSGASGQGAQGGTSAVMEWVVSEPVLKQETNLSFANATYTISLDEVFFTHQTRGEADALLYRAGGAGSLFVGGKAL